MIADWYFLNCLNFPPRRAAIILSIFEAIDAPRPDPALALKAVGELGGTEIWVHLYSIPKLVKLLHKTPMENSQLREAIRNLMLQVACQGEDSVSELLRNLIGLITSGDTKSNQWKNTISTLAKCITVPSAGTKPGVPYLDLKDRTVETFLLAGLEAAEIAIPADSLNSSKSGSTEERKITAILNAALEGRFGRLAALQTLVIQKRRGPGQHWDLVQNLVELKGSFPLHEPDLVKAVVNLLFTGKDSMADELLQLMSFRRLGRMLKPRAKREDFRLRENVMARLGIRCETERPLQLVLWQTALASLMAEERPSQLADCADLWWRRPPERDEVRLPLPVSISHSEPNVGAWFDGLGDLATLRFSKPVGRNDFFLVPRAVTNEPAAVEKDRKFFERKVVPLLFSPWSLSPEKQSPSAPEIDRKAEEGWRNELCLLRLCGATWQALRLLSLLPASSTADRSCLLRLLAHFEAAIGQRYRGWLRKSSEQDKPTVEGDWHLSSGVTTLALFAQKQLMAVIRGFRPGATPSDFVNLATGQGGWYEGILVRWVEDVFRYEGVAPHAEGWRAGLPSFAPSVTTRRKSDTLQQAAVILIRLFAPDSVHPNATWSQWERKTLSDIQNREVLVAPFANWEDWLNLHHLVVDPAPVTLQLTVSLERLLSHFDSTAEAENTRQQWCDDLARVLTRVTQPDHVDRFVTLRLVDLLAGPSLHGRDEIRFAIIQLLTERAYPVAFIRLTRLLLAPPPNQFTSLVWQKLRIALLRGLVAHGWLKGNYDKDMRDPLDVVYAAREGQFFTETVRNFLIGAAGLGISETAELRQEFIRLSKETNNSLIPGWRHLHGSCDLSQNGQHKLTIEKEENFDEWMFEQAVEDPDTGNFDLFFTPWDTPKVLKGLDAERLVFFAGVDANGDGIIIDQFDTWCGIKVPQDATEATGLPGRFLPSEQQFEFLNVTLREGDISEVEVSRPTDGINPGRLTLRRCFRGQRVKPPSERSEWDPDLSRTFWEKGEKRIPARRVPAIHLGDGNWKPTRNGLSIFLCQTALLDVVRATLTFICETQSDDGAKQWLFGGKPGELYEFGSDDFTTSAFEQIQNELNNYDAKANLPAKGLLISVEAVRSMDHVRLALVMEPWPEASHPNLRCPFDPRNLEWSQMFEEDGTLRAEYDATEARWFVSAKVDGFPSQVWVQWLGPQPDPTKQNWAEGVVEEWGEAEQRSRSIQARRTGSGLNLTNLPQLYENLSALDQGALTELFRLRNDRIPEDTHLWFLTRDGLSVRVSLDSLTLLPIKPGDDIQRLAHRRKLRFERLEWKEEETVQLTEDTVLPPELDNGWHTAIFAVVPSRDDVPSMCQVLFENDNSLRPIIIHEIEKVRTIMLGGRFRIEIKGGLIRHATAQSFKVHSTIVLWQIETQVAPEPGAYFVGECFWNNAKLWASESPRKPGVLRLSPPNARTAPIFLSAWDAESQTWSPSPLGATWKATNRGKDIKPKYLFGRCLYPIWLLPQDKHWAKHPVWKEGRLAGFCSRPMDASLCTVQRVSLRLIPAGDDVATVFREFEVELLRVARPRPALQVVLADTARKEKALEKIARRTPNDHPCRVDREGKTGQLTELEAEGFSEEQSVLEVVPDGGPWVPSGMALYLPQENEEHAEGRTLLEQIDGHWKLNFRRVPAWTLKEFQTKLNVKSGQRVKHDSFFFVGPVDNLTVEQIKVWRFEAGFGMVIEIPEDLLQSDGKRFDLRHLLFHGDRVREFEFIELQSPDGSSTTIALNIIKVTIESGRATTLYRQARDHQVVHVLQINASLEIKSIEGCDELGVKNASQSFNVPHARLDSNSTNRLQARFDGVQPGGKPKQGEKNESLYGRMNVRAFEDSHGVEVIFEHVRLAFDDEHGLSSSKEGNLLLLRAEHISETEDRNDVRLAFYALDGIADQDVDLRRIYVLRRSFSCQESLLRRLYAEPAQLDGQIFAVRLILDRERNGVFATMLENIPERRGSSLFDHAEQSSEPVFALVKDQKIVREIDTPEIVNSLLLLEHRPGIFFSLSSRDFNQNRLPKLPRGTLVRVAIQNRKFRLLICNFGDEFYFRGQRTVVAFPKNNLLWKNPLEAAQGGAEWWSQQKDFTLGDFPGTTCSPVSLGRDDTGLSQHAAAMCEFMSQTHPKVARACYPRNSRPYLIPGPGSTVFGALALDDKSNKDPSLTRSNVGGCMSLKWTGLTFCDASIADLLRRFRTRKWFYHEATTGYWRGGRVITHSVEPCTVETGLLFFEEGRDGLRLRYNRSKLLSLAIPVGDPSLTIEPAVQGESGDFVSLSVAGPAIERNQQIGLFLEYAPGRILHVPNEMFSWPAGDRRIPLGHLDWEHFAAGDEISVRIAKGSALAPDHLELLAWHRGPRGCFGQGKTLLPLQRFDSEQGYLRLGNGAFQLTIPSTSCPKNAASEAVQPLFLCALDDTLWLSEAEAISHILDKHFTTFYQVEKVPIDPPTGNFTFVARCGISGVILGPPNHYDYQDGLHRLHQERFSKMPFDAFKSRVQIVKDEVAVRKWLEDKSFRTEFICLNVPEEKRLISRGEIESHFLEVHFPNIFRKVDTNTDPAARQLLPSQIQRLLRGRNGILLSADNEIDEIGEHGCRLRPGDCCLLGVDQDSDNVIVQGMPGFVALPDRDANSKSWHGLETEVFYPASQDRDKQMNRQRLHQLIHAAGGSLPATIEGIIWDKQLIFFSFSEQGNGISPGRIALATPLGFLPGRIADGDRDPEKFLLWVGGGIMLHPFQEVVSGVPPSFRSAVAAALAKQRTLIWLATEEDGQISSGLMPDVRHDLTILPEAVAVCEGETDHDWGLVARSQSSQRLYWIPASDAAWTNLTATEAEKHFIKKTRRLFAARKIDEGGGKEFLSLLEARGALQEQENLRPGQQLRVFVRAPDSNSSDRSGFRWLAESPATGLLLLLKSPEEDRYRDGDLVLAEISHAQRIWRSARQWSIIVVPAGKRTYRLALPAQFTQPSAAITSELAWRNQAEWLAEADRQPWNEGSLATCPLTEPLERRLAFAVILARKVRGSTAAWNTAKEVLQLLEQDKEISLFRTLLAMEIMLRQILGATSRSEMDILWNRLLKVLDTLGRRALRSIHVEPFVEARLNILRTTSPEAQSIWCRIDALLNRTLGNPQMDHLTGLVRFAMLTGDDTTRSLSAAIYVSIGEKPSLELQQHRSSAVLVRLVKWRCLFSPWIKNGFERTPLPIVTTWLLNDLLRLQKKVKARALNIDLLPAMPPLSEAEKAGK
jgi:hypothetical protein